MGACQFGHGVGGFTANFIHSFRRARAATAARRPHRGAYLAAAPLPPRARRRRRDASPPRRRSTAPRHLVLRAPSSSAIIPPCATQRAASSSQPARARNAPSSICVAAAATRRCVTASPGGSLLDRLAASSASTASSASRAVALGACSAEARFEGKGGKGAARSDGRAKAGERCAENNDNTRAVTQFAFASSSFMRASFVENAWSREYRADWSARYSPTKKEKQRALRARRSSRAGRVGTTLTFLKRRALLLGRDPGSLGQPLRRLLRPRHLRNKMLRPARTPRDATELTETAAARRSGLCSRFVRPLGFSPNAPAVHCEPLAPPV